MGLIDRFFTGSKLTYDFEMFENHDYKLVLHLDAPWKAMALAVKMMEQKQGQKMPVPDSWEFDNEKLLKMLHDGLISNKLFDNTARQIAEDWKKFYFVTTRMEKPIIFKKIGERLKADITITGLCHAE